LMQRPAICCVQMRLTRSSRICRAPVVARMGFVRRQSTAAHPGMRRIAVAPQGTWPRAFASREGLDAAPTACVFLPFLLALEMCKDAACIADCTH
jgi:hypothetical protein